MPPKHVVDQTGDTVPAEDPRFKPFDEPVLDDVFRPLVSEHIWTNMHIKHVIVPFDDLPLPSSDRTRIKPCTVRFQFTGPFRAAEQPKAMDSILIQLKGIFARFGQRASPPWFRITFPTGVGRGKFVDVATSPLDLDKVRHSQLTFNKHRLEFVVSGPKLPHNTRVLEIVNVPSNLSGKSAAQTVAFHLQARDVGQILDMWKAFHQVSSEAADVAAVGNYTLVAALLPPELPNGEIPATVLHKIPGYIKLDEEHCLVKFNGRPEWCGRCKGDATYFHTFGDCQRLECFNCKERGHLSDKCPKKMQEDEPQPENTGDSTPRPSKRPTPAT